jgi:hypothetical protein
MSIGTIILIILVIALLGGFFPIGGDDVRPGRVFYGQGPGFGGLLGAILVIVLILVMLGFI